MSRRILIAATAVTISVPALAAAGIALRDAVYVDKPLPGVVVREAQLARPIRVTVGDHQFGVRPRRVLEVNRAATAAAALRAGRESFWTRVRQLANPRPPAIEVLPVLRERPIPARRWTKQLSEGLRAPTAAEVAMRGLTPVVTPARAGERIHHRLLLRRLRASVRGVGAPVSAPLERVSPELDTSAAEEAAAAAEQVVSAPVELRYADHRVGALPPRRLARLLRINPRRDSFAVTLDRDRLAAAVRPTLSRWRRQAVNARFRVEGEHVRIRPSRTGLDVDPKTALTAVTAATLSPSRTARLALRETHADRTTREARALGISERISTFTTDMGVSSSNRIHNVQLMAEYIDGTIIEPGESFSFNDRVGPRTEERGFREGQMIIGSLLLPSIGGGVCQTATTLFNNAFELGLPIERRYNHSFYISHYPMGRDATVSWDGPDLVFRNDLRSAILITTSYTNETLTFSFYGTDPERRIVSSTGPQVNWRQPETTYAYDPYAPRGSVRRVAGTNQPGFDVTVTREVYARGKLRRKDSFTSAYIAVGPTAIYGPGRTIPGPYFTLPRV